MANTVEIIIKAVDQASGNIGKAASSLDRFKDGFKSLTGMSLSTAGAIAAASTAISKIVDYTKKAVNLNVEYVSTIIDMARVLGISTEETSRLVQFSDDLFISQEKLNTAMLAASRQGIDVSVSGIKELSEQYLALLPGVERAQFLMQTFGRSGADMGKLLEIGPSGISAGLAGIEESLVVMESSQSIVIAYKQSIDAVGDAYAGLSYSVAQEAMPAMTTLNLIWADFVDTVSNSNIVTEAFGGILDMVSKALYFWDNILNFNLYNLLHYDEVTAEAAANAAILGGNIKGVGTSAQGTGAEIAALDVVMENLLKTMTEETDWKQAWTNITEGPDQPAQRAKKSFDLLGSKLTELGIQGADIWTGLLEATGQISPEAIKQFAIITAEFENIKRLTAAGIPVDVIVSITMNNLAGAGILPGGISPGANIGSWILKGTKGGPGTDKAWWNETTGSWYYGEQPPGKAGGGPVWGSTPYIVGEKGPELFVPGQSGQIIPNNKLGGSNVTFYGDAYFAIDRELTAQDIMKQMRVEA